MERTAAALGSGNERFHGGLEVLSKASDRLPAVLAVGGPQVALGAAFGWAVRTVNGHDFAELTDALGAPLDAGRPSAIIANTRKGRGVSFMEDDNNWHYRSPTEEEVAEAKIQLGLAS